MVWFLLVVAGLLETAMAIALKASGGFSRLAPSALFLVFGGASFWLLSVALRSLPVGTAYAVWTGIGAAGTALAGIVFLGEPATALRLGCIALIIAAVIGLRFAGGH
jgi:quaternary ammonium compound-resistance protein SugE